MQRRLIGAGLFVLSSLVFVSDGRADPLPTEIGACTGTTITEIGYRLGDPGTGSAISYANGGADLLRHDS